MVAVITVPSVLCGAVGGALINNTGSSPASMLDVTKIIITDDEEENNINNTVEEGNKSNNMHAVVEEEEESRWEQQEREDNMMTIRKANNDNSKKNTCNIINNVPSSSSSSDNNNYNYNDDDRDDRDRDRGPLRVMFLSADAGGGHKASASALTKQFELLYPGSICESFHLEEILPENAFPYSNIATSYKALTSKPNMWRTIYHFSNTKVVQKVVDYHTLRTCENSFLELLHWFHPDVVISVHPNLNFVPCIATRKFERRMKNKKIPFYTVVTDLGSGHDGWWNQPDVDKLFLASDKIKDLCLKRGRTPESKIVLTGLPIRHEFGVIAKKRSELMVRMMMMMTADDDADERSYAATSSPDDAFKRTIKTELNLCPNKSMVLVMGGGEGVGSLREIVSELYSSLHHNGIDATICVVCAKNKVLKQQFENTNWDRLVVATQQQTSLRTTVMKRLQQQQQQKQQQQQQRKIQNSRRVGRTTTATHDVTVVPLGFVTKMAEYMAGADILITKAGPGTIAEAASIGLPLLLTSYLPGQEAGNVELVLDHGFGEYRTKPKDIASVVTEWIAEDNNNNKKINNNYNSNNSNNNKNHRNGGVPPPVRHNQRKRSKLQKMSDAALAFGNPTAGKDIVIQIGSETHAWLKHNDETIFKQRRR